MSLISKPLDYSSGSTQAAIQGIRGQLQMAAMGAEQERRERKQADAKIGSFEKAMSAAEGSVEYLPPKARQVFGAFHEGYKMALDAYEDNATQENLNAINKIISEANTYLSQYEGLRNSDKSTLLTGIANPDRYGVTTETMYGEYSMRHGEESGYDSVRWDSDLGTVVVSGGGLVNARASQDPMFDPKNVMVFPSKANIPNIMSAEDYGGRYEGLYYNRGREEFDATLRNRLATQENLQFSAAASLAAMDYGSDPQDLTVGIQNIMSDPEQMDRAIDLYVDNAWRQASIMHQRRREQENTGMDYSGSDQVTFTSEDYDYDNQMLTTTKMSADIPTFERPIKVLIEADPGNETTPTYQRVVLGAAQLPDGQGIVVKENVGTTYYQDPNTGETSSSPQPGWTEMTRYENRSRVIKPSGTEGRKEYAAYVNALKKQNALNQEASLRVIGTEQSALPGPPMPPQ
jgi:hypothetical protein